MEKMMNLKLMHESDKKQTLLQLLLMALLSILAVGLGYAILSLPAHTPGLRDLVGVNLENSGASNPVTAVLLNFRGYDTLLEMGVLLLALLGIWSLGDVTEPRESSPGPVLNMLSGLLTPLMILVAGYLLWVGGHAPGGAFQAGSVFGAAGVLLLLAGWRPGAGFVGLALRMALVIGLVVFVLLGLVFVLMGKPFLEYPPLSAKSLILLIEAVATFSIGIALAALFLGGRPEAGANKP